MNPIVGIGELLWDVFPDGRKVAGGAPFNFAYHCRQLGHDAVIVSRVGDDVLGRELREEVKRLGMSDEFIQTDREHPTGTIRVAVDAAGQPTYTIAEDVAWDYVEWGGNIEQVHETARAVCYGSLGARAARSRETLDRFLSPFARGVDRELIVCDVNIRPTTPQGVIDWSLTRSDWLKLNSDELGRLAGRCGDVSAAVRQRFSQGVVIVTLGDRGCEVVSPDSFREPGVPARVVDTVGAGDAFTAAMVCLHLEGRSLRECARFANHYAARVCEFQGATPRIDRTDVARAAFGSSA